MKNKILNHIDLWLKMLFQHFDKHKIQGRIFFAELGLSILVWTVIIAIYVGDSLKNLLINFSKCK